MDIKGKYLRPDLIRELVLKDIRLRYARSKLGLFWAFLSPFFFVLVLYVIFSLFLKISIKEAPFFLYLMCGVFPWRFFNDSIMCSVTSLMDNKNLIKESNFPQYLIVLSVVLAQGIVFLPSLFVAAVISLVTLKGLPVFAFLLPVVLVCHLALTFGLSLGCSIIYLKIRDFKYILELFLFVLFYFSPIFYSVFLVKETFSRQLFNFYIANPLVAILSLYRASLLKGFYSNSQPELSMPFMLMTSIIFSAIFLFSAFYIYNKHRGKINDYLSY